MFLVGVAVSLATACGDGRAHDSRQLVTQELVLPATADGGYPIRLTSLAIRYPEPQGASCSTANCPLLEAQEAEMGELEKQIPVLKKEWDAALAKYKECIASYQERWNEYQECVGRGQGGCRHRQCSAAEVGKAERAHTRALERLNELEYEWSVNQTQDTFDNCCVQHSPCTPFNHTNPQDRSQTQQCIADCAVDLRRCMEGVAIKCAVAGGLACLAKSTKPVRCALAAEVCIGLGIAPCALKAKACNQGCRERFNDVDGCAEN